MFARKEVATVPEIGSEAPEFNLPSAQGGQLRLSMRTARGPVVVVFYEGPTDEEVAYFRDLAAREDEINMAGGSVVGIGVAEPDEARDFVERTGLRSYVLYDYTRITTREYGLLEKDKGRGEHARPATFVIDGDNMVVHAWVGERPKAEEVLAKVSEITGLPKEPAEETGGEEKPKKRAEGGGAEAGGAAGEEKPKKLTAEERQRIKAERRAAREAGTSLKTGPPDPKESPEEAAGDGAAEGAAPERKRLSPEEREKRRAERRAAREAGGGSAAAQPAKDDGGAEAAAGEDGTEREREGEPAEE